MTTPASEGDTFGLSVGRPESFEEVLRAAQLGEGAALSELWSHFSGRIAAFVRARGAVDVDEITNDVFLAAFTGLADFRGDLAGFRALLFTIARRRVADEVRRRTRRVQSVPWSPFDDEHSTSGPEDALLEQESGRLLLERLERLTPDQRDVVLLRLVADLSLDEVATVLGKSIGTVKSLQRRGLDALRRAWDDAEPSVGLPDQRKGRS